MKTSNPKVRVISVEEAGKMNKNNVAYFTLTDGSVAVVKKDAQKNRKINNDYSNLKYNQINNNINNNNKGYQIIEAIPVKFCCNPNMRNYSQPQPLYVKPYLNPEIICAEVENDNYGDNNNFTYQNQNRAFNQRKMY